jgi:hypothetical protein
MQVPEPRHQFGGDFLLGVEFLGVFIGEVMVQVLEFLFLLLLL